MARNKSENILLIIILVDQPNIQIGVGKVTRGGFDLLEDDF